MFVVHADGRRHVDDCAANLRSHDLVRARSWFISPSQAMRWRKEIASRNRTATEGSGGRGLACTKMRLVRCSEEDGARRHCQTKCTLRRCYRNERSRSGAKRHTNGLLHTVSTTTLVTPMVLERVRFQSCIRDRPIRKA